MNCSEQLVRLCHDQKYIPVWNCETGEELVLVPVFNALGQLIPVGSQAYPSATGFIASYFANKATFAPVSAPSQWSANFCGPSPDPVPTPTYSAQRLTGLTGGVVPANTHHITIANRSTAGLRVTLPGGNVQLVHPDGVITLANPREEGEPAFAAGAIAIAAVDGAFTAAGRIYINYKSY